MKITDIDTKKIDRELEYLKDAIIEFAMNITNEKGKDWTDNEKRIAALNMGIMLAATAVGTAAVANNKKYHGLLDLAIDMLKEQTQVRYQCIYEENDQGVREVIRKKNLVEAASKATGMKLTEDDLAQAAKELMARGVIG